MSEEGVGAQLCTEGPCQAGQADPGLGMGWSLRGHFISPDKQSQPRAEAAQGDFQAGW